MNAVAAIHQNSLDTEYYTPAKYMIPARQMLGGFDLDPASSVAANQTVQAAKIFTAPEMQYYGQAHDKRPIYRIGWGALDEEWHGRVWMNHPFASPEKACAPDCTKKTCRKRGYHVANNQPGSKHWVEKLVASFMTGRVKSAVMICFAAVSASWFRPLLDFPILVPYGRVNYLKPDGTVTRQVTKDSVLVALGVSADEFRHYYEIDAGIGKVKV